MDRIENLNQARRIISELERALDVRQSVVSKQKILIAMLTKKCDSLTASLKHEPEKDEK